MAKKISREQARFISGELEAILTLAADHGAGGPEQGPIADCGICNERIEEALENAIKFGRRSERSRVRARS